MFDTRLYLCPGAIYAEVMSKVLNTNQAIIYSGAIFSDEDNKTKAISVNHFPNHNMIMYDIPPPFFFSLIFQ